MGISEACLEGSEANPASIMVNLQVNYRDRTSDQKVSMAMGYDKMTMLLNEMRDALEVIDSNQE